MQGEKEAHLFVEHGDGLVEGIEGLALEQDLLGGALVLLVVGVVQPRLLVIAPVDLFEPALHHLEVVYAALAQVRVDVLLKSKARNNIT